MENQKENSPKRNKTVGIVLSAAYFAIANGLLSLISSIPLLFISGLEVPAWVTLIGVVLLGRSILSFVTCYGLWMLIDWGRKLGIAISAISIPLELVTLKIPRPQMQTPSSTIMLVIVDIAIDVLIIWYLSKGNVKSLFSEVKT